MLGFPPEAKSTGGGIGFSVNRVNPFVIGTFVPVTIAAGALGEYVVERGNGLVILVRLALMPGKETKKMSLISILYSK